MYVLPTRDLQLAPVIGKLFGTVSNDNVLQAINTYSNNSQVIFEQDNPITRQFNNLVNFVKNSMATSMDFVDRAVNVLSGKNKIRAIEKEEHFNFIPECMYEPILMCEPVKQLFMEDRIYGFGYKALPDEDVWGRLINNGKVHITKETKPDEVKFEWKWKFTDPVHTIEDIEAVEKTRGFICSWYEKEMQKEDRIRDITDWPNHISE